MNKKAAFIVTTIAPPTPLMEKWVQKHNDSFEFFIIGDKKGPNSYIDGCNFYSLDRQLELNFKLSKALPINHYSRKNLGYLEAWGSGHTHIFETDDDNGCLDNFTTDIVKLSQKLKSVDTDKTWENIYSYFSDDKIWPRGLPLTAINETPKPLKNCSSSYEDHYIYQLLPDSEPDVDAIWRLVFGDKKINFRKNLNIFLPPNVYSPFNSSATWWKKEAFPLLYLPCTCSFRMTDIWRGFVALRCLHEEGKGIVYSSPQVYQDRNVHNLHKDFLDELDGYSHNSTIIEDLNRIKLNKGDLIGNLRLCYESLVKSNYIKKEELRPVDAWVSDCTSLT